MKGILAAALEMVGEDLEGSHAPRSGISYALGPRKEI